MQFYPDVAAVQVWTVLKMKEAKRLVWNMCLLYLSGALSEWNKAIL